MTRKNLKKFRRRAQAVKSRAELEALAAKQPQNFRRFFKDDIDVIVDELFPAAQ